MSKLFKCILFCLFFILGIHVYAESGSAASAEATGSVEYSGKQSDDWVKVETELSAVKTKLDAQKAQLDQLLDLSKKNQKMTKEQMTLLNETFAKYKAMVQEYNEKLEAFELKYPEKGQAEKRTYQRLKVQGSEEVSYTSTLSSRIKAINKKIESQYGLKKIIKTEKNKKDEIVPPAYKATPIKKNPITDKIILVK